MPLITTARPSAIFSPLWPPIAPPATTSSTLNRISSMPVLRTLIGSSYIHSTQKDDQEYPGSRRSEALEISAFTPSLFRFLRQRRVVSMAHAQSALRLSVRRGPRARDRQATLYLPVSARPEDPESAAEWFCAEAAPHKRDRSLRAGAIPVRLASAPA